MKRNFIKIIIVLSFSTNALMADPMLAFPKELIGRHHGAMGQFGEANKDGVIHYNEDHITLGGLEIKADGELVVPFSHKGEFFKNYSFKLHESHVSGAAVLWQPLKVENDQYSAKLMRYGSVFRVLVKQQRADGNVYGIQWICAEPVVKKPATQSGAEPENGDDTQPKLGDDSKSQSMSQPWENHRLTHEQPFPARVVAVLNSWVGYKLLLEEAEVESPRYCHVEIFTGGRLNYTPITKEEASEFSTSYKIEPVMVSDFSTASGVFKLGKKFGEEDFLLSVIAEAKIRKQP